jgi:hypothetical protein
MKTAPPTFSGSRAKTVDARRPSWRIAAPDRDRRARGGGVDSLQCRDYQMVPRLTVILNGAFEAFFKFAGRIR